MKYQLIASGGHYNKFKKCFCSSVSIVEIGGTRCLAAYQNEFKSKDAAIRDAKRQTKVMLEQYSEVLNEGR